MTSVASAFDGTAEGATIGFDGGGLISEVGATACPCTARGRVAPIASAMENRALREAKCGSWCFISAGWRRVQSATAPPDTMKQRAASDADLSAGHVAATARAFNSLNFPAVVVRATLSDDRNGWKFGRATPASCDPVLQGAAADPARGVNVKTTRRYATRRGSPLSVTSRIRWTVWGWLTSGATRLTRAVAAP